MSKKEYIKPSLKATEIELANSYALDIHSSIGGTQYIIKDRNGSNNPFATSWDTSSFWGD